MRITQQLMVNNAITNMDDNLERIHNLQQKIATGKQFQSMSDDPSRATTALTLRSTLQTNQNFIDNNHTINDWLTANDAGLQNMVTAGSRANNLVLQGASDTMSLEERTALANEIDEILVQSVDIANTKHNGKYIFAGFATKSATPPFVLDAAHTAVTPNDDTHSIQLNISPGQTMTTNFIGRAIFAPLFQALIDARDALLSNNAANIQPTITSLQTAMDPVTTALTTNGARQRQLQVTIDTMESSKIQLKSLLSSKEDVNMAEAISQLANQETTYQSVIEVSQRAINTINLFDVLR